MHKKENTKDLEKLYHKSSGVVAVKKPGVTNNPNHKNLNLAKVLDEEADFTAKKLPSEFKIAMSQARTKAGLTQKELSHLLSVKETLVKSYENGTAYPDNAFIQKIEKVLKCNLPRAKKNKNNDC